MNVCTISEFEKNAVYDDMGYKFKMKFENKRNRKKCFISLGERSAWQIVVWTDLREDLEKTKLVFRQSTIAIQTRQMPHH